MLSDPPDGALILIGLHQSQQELGVVSGAVGFDEALQAHAILQEESDLYTLHVNLGQRQNRKINLWTCSLCELLLPYRFLLG